MEELILKTCGNDYFDLQLKLRINSKYGEEDIFCIVVLQNKINDQKQSRIFDPRQFRDALSYYAQQEAMFIEPKKKGAT